MRACSVTALLLATAVAFGSGIKWKTDATTALKLAKKTKKAILIDFYGDY